MKVGLVIIATGKYNCFFDDLYKSCEKNFLPEVEKTYFYFTDDMESELPDNVVRIHREHMKWPFITLYRFKTFNKHRDTILKSGVDYVFYLDVDMEIVDKVGEEILPKADGKSLTCVFHPGFYNNKVVKKPHETNKKSNFFVKEKKRKLYVAGGFQGGEAEAYLDVAKLLDDKIDEDVSNDIIPVWHDESAWNWFLTKNHKKFIAMKPDYCYPQMADRKQFASTYRAIVNIKPKILALEKDHKEFQK